MIFKFSIDKVLSGEKTQTRRLVKPDQRHFKVWGHRTKKELAQTMQGIAQEMMMDKKRVIYQVGKTYAVQPNRGKTAMGRIKLLEIRQEDVRKITREDAIADGFTGEREFLEAWCTMYDPVMAGWEYILSTGDSLIDYSSNSEWWETVLSRPDNLYQAWVLTFELCQEG